MGAAAAMMECPKANRVPERVARMDLTQRILWLDSEEAHEHLTHSKRRELKRRWKADIVEAWRGGVSHVVVDPKSESAQAKLAEERTIEKKRLTSPVGVIDGTAECTCKQCRKKSTRWPSYYVDRWLRGARRRWPLLSYECHLEKSEPDEVDRIAAVPDHMAFQAGLRIVRRHVREPKPAVVLVAGCETCGGMRPRGDRFCMKCRKLALAIERATRCPATAYMHSNNKEEWGAIGQQLEAEGYL